MAKIKYVVPSVEFIQFGNEDFVCTVSGWTPDGKPSNGFGVVEEGDGDYSDNDF